MRAYRDEPVSDEALERILARAEAPRALALMTASFGLGQVIGPLLGAMLVGPNNDFLPPTIMASSVLALSAVMLVPLLGRRSVD